MNAGGKLEHSEITHACKRRTISTELHTERPQTGFKPGTDFLWGDSANHHTAVKSYEHTWQSDVVLSDIHD